MTHSMSIFRVIRSAAALSITAALNIRPDTRTTKRLGQESSRPSPKPIPLCMINRRTFARSHSVRMLATPADMTVPGERFLSGPMQRMTVSTPSKALVRRKDIASDEGQLAGRCARPGSPQVADRLCAVPPCVLQDTRCTPNASTLPPSRSKALSDCPAHRAEFRRPSDNRSGWRATAKTKCPCASAC